MTAEPQERVEVNPKLEEMKIVRDEDKTISEEQSSHAPENPQESVSISKDKLEEELFATNSSVYIEGNHSINEEVVSEVLENDSSVAGDKNAHKNIESEEAQVLENNTNADIEVESSTSASKKVENKNIETEKDGLILNEPFNDVFEERQPSLQELRKRNVECMEEYYKTYHTLEKKIENWLASTKDGINNYYDNIKGSSEGRKIQLEIHEKLYSFLKDQVKSEVEWKLAKCSYNLLELSKLIDVPPVTINTALLNYNSERNANVVKENVGVFQEEVMVAGDDSTLDTHAFQDS